MDIDQLEIYVALKCLPSYDHSIFMRTLVVCQFFPLFLTIGMYTISLTYKYQELYYRFFSFGLTLNWLLNWLLQNIIQSKPRIQNCGDGFAMPSFHSQHCFFFYTMVITYLLLQRRRMGIFNLLILNAVPALVCAARFTLGFNTFSELMVGCIMGTSFGFVYQYILLKWVKPRVPRLLEVHIVRWLGFTDHFFYEEDVPVSNNEKDLAFAKATCIYCQLGFGHEIHY